MRNKEFPFLHNLVKDIISSDKRDYSKLSILLPTKRSVLYTKYHFANLSKETILLPSIQTFEEFVYEHSKLEYISQEEALLHLHSVFSEIRQKYKFAFEDFLNYSILLLKDFDLIDQNLADEKQIFSFLSQAESIKRWSEDLGEENLSFDENGLVNDYFTFWNICQELYKKFRAKLLKKSLATTGMAYRHFHENFQSLVDQIDAESFHICGFNYLTNSQKEILRALDKNFKTSYSWDADKYYYDLKYHEAGKYLRGYKDFNVKNSLKSYYADNRLPISRTISCPNKNSQVKKAVDEILEVLEGLDYETEIKDRKDLIALIPSDENLLKIILESFPEKFKDKSGKEYETYSILNISIGRSLRDSRFYQLLRMLFDLQEAISDNGNKVYYPRLKEVLFHPFIRKSLGSFDIPKTLDENVRKMNKAYLQKEEVITKDDSRTIQLILQKWKLSGSEFSDFGTELIDIILENSEGLPGDERIFLAAYKTVFKNLKGLIDQFQTDLDHKSFRKLFFQLLNQYSIPFSGEPISPLQIIGLLETRALDFEHVFILSCNEGSLPKARSQDSLFPFDVKMEFGIPTFIDMDASLSYTFYRLFHRSETVNLFYHNSNDRLQGRSSPSRFLLQLKYELFPEMKNELKEENVFHFFPDSSQKQIEVKKSDEVIRKIESEISRKNSEGEERGLSPSLINKYLRDPISFFKQTVLNVYEPDVLEEEFEASTFGTVVHEVLDKMFSPFQESNINGEIIEAIRKKTNIDQRIREEIKLAAGNIELETGPNRLYLHIAKTLIERYLKLISQEESFFLLATECPLTNTFSFRHEKLDRDVKVTIYGKADRIDFAGDKVKILDYKTGGLRNNKIKYENYDKLLNSDIRDKILQLLIYKYLLIKNRKKLAFMKGMETKSIEAGFYFFRKGDHPFIALEYDDKYEDEEVFVAEVEGVITQIVSEMLDPDISFSQKQDSE